MFNNHPDFEGIYDKAYSLRNSKTKDRDYLVLKALISDYGADYAHALRLLSEAMDY